ncbi:MAG TPA: pentapeptide repeat-containing protein [Candidatus Binatia bacterium]|jgi:uncharacterized protein YjbI with pentapeptide repeats
MEEPEPTSTTSRPPAAPDAKALLDAANSASEKVAVLHIAFLALCAYILVIVFSTTDMDLLIGKGVKLPVVDVEVPIVGFYAVVPFLLVLFHFNLLLSLQLLSHKLYAFDDAAHKKANTDGLYDQLNIFPFNYYLVGRPSRLVKNFLALVVTITILLLPLAALLTLQARFLAYQSEAVTWMQRTAIWFDVILVVTLWPVIMDRRHRWWNYIRCTWQRGPFQRLRSLSGLTGFLIALWLLFVMEMDEKLAPSIGGKTGERETYLVWVADQWLFSLLIACLLLSLFSHALERGVHWVIRRLRRGHHFAASSIVTTPSLGVPGLVATLMLGLPLPLMLVVDGEKIDRPDAFGTHILESLRHLDLHERVLLAKPAPPEIIADLRRADPAKRETALRSIQPIDLQNRSLRGANLSSVLLPKADLRGAELQGANLRQASLQGADLSPGQLEDRDPLQRAASEKELVKILVQAAKVGQKLKVGLVERRARQPTQLQSADLREAQLQGANLRQAQLHGADLERANLQGVDLSGAQLQGADLSGARLEGAELLWAQLWAAILPEAQLKGAYLWRAELQGADLARANLQGADLSGAKLQGANLARANLQGANLREAIIYSKSIDKTVVELVDARGLKWQPLPSKELKRLREAQLAWAWAIVKRPLKLYQLDKFNEAIQEAAVAVLARPQIGRCLRNKGTQVRCKDLSPEHFRELFLPEMEKLACQSSDIARRVLRLRPIRPSLLLGSEAPATKGLALRLQKRVKKAENNDSCPGLTNLTEEDKASLSELASKAEAHSPTVVVPKR